MFRGVDCLLRARTVAGASDCRRGGYARPVCESLAYCAFRRGCAIVAPAPSVIATDVTKIKPPTALAAAAVSAPSMGG